MSTTSSPVRATGLPAGVHPGALGARVLAQVIDLLVPVLIVVVSWQLGQAGTGASAAVSLLGFVLVAAWGLLVWWMFATRAAGPGMRVVRLQLVGLRDGRPIGWGRFVVRSLILAVLTLSVVGLVIMLVLLVRHPRREGWHDQVAESVVIKERPLAPRRASVAPVGSDSVPVVALQPAPGEGEVALEAPVAAPASASAAPAVVPAVVAADVAADQPVQPSPAAEEAKPTADQRLTTTWVAVLDDGRKVTVQGLVLLGRNPQSRPGEEDAELVRVSDDTRTVSKTHLSLHTEADGLYLTDRGSTNGTILTDTEGNSRPCPAGDAVWVREGIVSFGDHWLTIEAHPDR